MKQEDVIVRMTTEGQIVVHVKTYITLRMAIAMVRWLIQFLKAVFIQKLCKTIDCRGKPSGCS